MTPIDLSIIIPAYNEAHKIARDVAAASRFLQENQIPGEVIIADDGSPDATADTAERAAQELAPDARGQVRILRLNHAGKGSAVRQGMVASRGLFTMFADSGVCVPYSDALPALELLKTGQCEIAHASRKLKTSVIDQGQTFSRRILSRAFRTFTLFYLHLPKHLTDTQCGFKLYRGDVARELYGQSISDGFMFDLEILMRARRAGYRVLEFPIHWSCDPDSRLKPAAIASRTLSDLRTLKKLMASQPQTTPAEPAPSAK